MKPNSSVLSGRPTSLQALNYRFCTSTIAKASAMAFFAGLSASENLEEYCTLEFEKMSSFLKNSA
jgi:hypothetical protein